MSAETRQAEEVHVRKCGTSRKKKMNVSKQEEIAEQVRHDVQGKPPVVHQQAMAAWLSICGN